MTSHRNPTLSKSRFIAGRQCLKRLYLESYHHDLADPIAGSQQYRFDTGNEVGELARRRFPGGRLIEETSPATRPGRCDNQVSAVRQHGSAALRSRLYL